MYTITPNRKLTAYAFAILIVYLLVRFKRGSCFHARKTWAQFRLYAIWIPLNRICYGCLFTVITDHMYFFQFLTQGKFCITEDLYTGIMWFTGLHDTFWNATLVWGLYVLIAVQVCVHFAFFINPHWLKRHKLLFYADVCEMHWLETVFGCMHCWHIII